MATYSKEVDNGVAPQNMRTIEEIATGKTNTTMKYFNMMEERFSNIVCGHVNCQINTTKYRYSVRYTKRYLGSR
jgi:hypothetical protein